MSIICMCVSLWMWELESVYIMCFKYLLVCVLYIFSVGFCTGEYLWVCLGRSMYEVGGKAKWERCVRILVSAQYLASTNQDSVFTSLGKGLNRSCSFPIFSCWFFLTFKTKIPYFLRLSWTSERELISAPLSHCPLFIHWLKSWSINLSLPASS